MGKRFVCLFLLWILLLTGCAPGPAEGARGYAFTDAGGRELTLPRNPRRVAVLFSSFADVWVSAGGEVAITVGEAVERGFAPADTLLVDRGAGKTIDRELLVSYGPDLVICSADIAAQRETADYLNEIGIPCAAFHVETFEEYLAMLAVCTELTGNARAYQTCGLEVQAELEEIKAQASEALAGKEPEILFIRAGSQSGATKAKTAEENFVCAMLKELGTYNIAENAPILLDGLSLEEILLADPDYIFISTMGDAEAARAYMDGVLAGEEWQALKAVRTGRYVYLPKELFQFKPNARWAEAYRYLADCLETAA